MNLLLYPWYFPWWLLLRWLLLISFDFLSSRQWGYLLVDIPTSIPQDDLLLTWVLTSIFVWTKIGFMTLLCQQCCPRSSANSIYCRFGFTVLMFELSYFVHVGSVLGNLSRCHITFCSCIPKLILLWLRTLDWLHPHSCPFLYSWTDTLLLLYASWIYVYALLSIVIYTTCLWSLNALCSPLSFNLDVCHHLYSIEHVHVSCSFYISVPSW